MAYKDPIYTESDAWAVSGSRKWASRMISWLGLGMIGLLVIPTGILIGLMFVVWSVTDRMVRMLSKKSARTAARVRMASGGYGRDHPA